MFPQFIDICVKRTKVKENIKEGCEQNDSINICRRY